MTTAMRLPRSFYARDAPEVARALLGKIIVHQDGAARRAARVVETEAYHGEDDEASHARFGPTPRAAIMFGPPGVAYVYLVYGLSHCMNVVTGDEGFPSAVLLRAAESIEGCLHLTSGPGNLTRALGISRKTHNGLDVTGDVLFFEDAPPPAERIVVSPRVNVAYAGRWAAKRWRFALDGNRSVSRPSPSPRPSPRKRGEGGTHGASGLSTSPRPAKRGRD